MSMRLNKKRDRKGLTVSKNAARIVLVNVVDTVSGELVSPAQNGPAMPICGSLRPRPVLRG